MKLLILLSLFTSWSHAEDITVTKAQFTEAMKTALPNAFCGEKQYFRKCFKITEDECIKEAMRATKTCLMSIDSEIPAKIHQPEDGQKWGSKVGACAGSGFEVSVIKSKIDSADCKDASKWK